MPWGAIIGAIIGGAGSYLSAQSANQPRTGTTNQTTNQLPLDYNDLNPNIQSILQNQAALFNQGPPDLLSYMGYKPLQGPYGGPAGGAPGGTPAPGLSRPVGSGNPSGVGNGGGAPIPKGGSANYNYNSKGVATVRGGRGTSKNTPPGTPGATGAGNFPGGGPPGGGYNVDGAKGIENAVANLGLNSVNSPLMQLGQGQMAKILNTPGFVNNPVLSGLQQQLTSQESDQGPGMINSFLGGNRSGGVAGGPTAPGGPMPGAPGYGGPGNAPTAANQSTSASQGNGNGSYIPMQQISPTDTSGTGTFGQAANAALGEYESGGNSPGMDLMTQRMTDDAKKAFYASQANLDAQAQGGGRYGGDTYNYDSSQNNLSFNRNLDQEIAGLRYQNYQDSRNAATQMAQDVNSRDIATMGANTTLGTSAMGYNLGLSAQDLQAIQDQMNNEQGNRALQAGLGQTLAGQQTSALGLTPAMQQANLSGAGIAEQAGGQEANLQATGMQIGMQNRMLQANLASQQASAPQNFLNNYLRTVAGIGGMGGTSNTTGVNVQPGLGISPYGSAMFGASGGAAAGAGLSQYYGWGG